MEEKTIKLLLLIPLYLFILIASVVAYNQFKLSQEIGDNPCWACGKYYGKQCFQAFPDREIRSDPEKLENWLTELADGNSKVEQVQQNENYNPSGVNLTISNLP